MEPEEARAILDQTDADYAEVVRPYLVGDDITEEPQQRPRRYILDFGMRSLEDAMTYPEAIRLVRERVKPKRDKNNREAYRRYWWRFAEPRPKMRARLDGLARYIAGNRRASVSSSAGPTPRLPQRSDDVFAFDDDYSMGVLMSSIHGAWARSEASTLRVDLRYTPDLVFRDVSLAAARRCGAGRDR